MKKEFEDGSFISLDKTNDKLIISVGARQGGTLNINSVELTKEEFANLLEDENE